MNLRDLLQKQLPEDKLSLLIRIGEIAAQDEMMTFLVGGAVRDLLLGRGNLDLDIVVEGDANALARKAQAAIGGEVIPHSRFGTAKYSLGAISLDLATSRSEIYYKPGVLPTVRPSPIKEDLARRDFSINALAASLHPKNLGELLDPFNGERDLANKVVRVLHDKSFVDDATRILRGIRYEQRLSFSFDSFTETRVRRDASMLGTISGDRVRHEVERWFMEPTVTAIMDRAQELGVLQAIYPGFPWSHSLRQQFLTAQEEAKGVPDPRAYLAILAFSLSEEACSGLVHRLSMSGAWRKVIEDVHRLKERLPELKKKDLAPIRIYRTLQGLNEFSLEGYFIACSNATVKERIRLYLRELQHVNPWLNGSDLLKLGVPQGAYLGEIMRRSLEMRINGKTHSPADEEALVRQWLQEDVAKAGGSKPGSSVQGGSYLG